VIDPTYPTPSGSGTVLPPSRIELGPQQTQPTVHQASIGYDRSLGEWGNFRTDYLMLRGTDVLRSVNINAPVNGVRPDPLSGNVNEIRADGERAFDRITVGVLLRVPNRRIMGNVMYQFGNSRNDADSVLSIPSNSLNPDADWGPAANDIRHRVFFMANTPLPQGIRASMQAQYSSAPPYNITTGLDDNGDTVFNDRPAGVGRNSARGASQWNVNFRVNRSFSLGGLLGDGPVMLGPPPPPPSGNAQRGPTGGAGDGGGGGQMQMIMDGNASRYRLDLYLQVFNLFNTTNLNQYVGNQLSPYFGTATSAAAPRRIELGASLSF